MRSAVTMPSSVRRGPSCRDLPGGTPGSRSTHPPSGARSSSGPGRPRCSGPATQPGTSAENGAGRASVVTPNGVEKCRKIAAGVGESRLRAPLGRIAPTARCSAARRSPRARRRRTAPSPRPACRDRQTERGSTGSSRRASCRPAGPRQAPCHAGRERRAGGETRSRAVGEHARCADPARRGPGC